MKKRFFAFLLAAVMIVGLLPATALAVTGTPLTGGGDLSGGTYYLNGNVDLTGAVVIKGNVTLDLNGYVLNRGLISSTGSTTSNSKGSVIYVDNGGSLTLTDSGTTQHKFKKLESGLWVLDETSGTELITGGVITGGTGTKDARNSDHFGGGIYVVGGGSLTIKGGNIVGNYGAKFGGGVFSDQNGSFRLEGGTICGNLANIGGGIALGGGQTGVMTGGFIRNNTATHNDDGGGIGLISAGGVATMYLTGGVITANTAPVGAGVRNKSNTFYVGGNIVISGNKSLNGSESNFFTDMSAGGLLCCDGTGGHPVPNNMNIGVGRWSAVTIKLKV